MRRALAMWAAVTLTFAALAQIDTDLPLGFHLAPSGRIHIFWFLYAVVVAVHLYRVHRSTPAPAAAPAGPVVQVTAPTEEAHA